MCVFWHLFCAVLRSMSCLAQPYFPRDLIKGTIKKKTFWTKCVFWFPLQFLPETFLILRRIQQDSIINIHRSSRKLPVILVRFKSDLNFQDRFSKYTQISNLVKICRMGVELFSLGRQMNRHDEGNSCYSQFVNV